MVALRSNTHRETEAVEGRKRTAFGDLTNLGRTYGAKDTKAQATAVVAERPELAWVRNLPEVDQPDAEASQAAAEYAANIHSYLLEREQVLRLDDYMSSQDSLTEKMRGVLVDWLVEVHWKFKLSPETLYLTVALLDRYLASETVRRAKLQLVGVTCLLIGSKHEEIYPPDVKQLVKVTDNTYTRMEILEMEVTVLKALKFEVTTPTPLPFFARLLKVQGTTIVPTKELASQISLVNYILELALCQYSFTKYAPSMLAAAALFLSNKILKVSPAWPFAVAQVSYPDSKIKHCAKEMCSLLQGAEKSSFQSVYKKFSHSQYHRVARQVA